MGDVHQMLARRAIKKKCFTKNDVYFRYASFKQRRGSPLVKKTDSDDESNSDKSYSVGGGSDTEPDEPDEKPNTRWGSDWSWFEMFTQ